MLELKESLDNVVEGDWITIYEQKFPILVNTGMELKEMDAQPNPNFGMPFKVVAVELPFLAVHAFINNGVSNAPPLIIDTRFWKVRQVSQKYIAAFQGKEYPKQQPLQWGV